MPLELAVILFIAVFGGGMFIGFYMGHTEQTINDEVSAQLKRKKQECEYLKDAISNMGYSCFTAFNKEAKVWYAEARNEKYLLNTRSYSQINALSKLCDAIVEKEKENV